LGRADRRHVVVAKAGQLALGVGFAGRRDALLDPLLGGRVQVGEIHLAGLVDPIELEPDDLALHALEDHHLVVVGGTDVVARLGVAPAEVEPTAEHRQHQHQQHRGAGRVPAGMIVVIVRVV
jgi:hypothetical protein